MDLARYLERIDYRGDLAPTAENLRALHIAHLYAVPFENLSVARKEPIVLDEAALFEKIVVRRRGGFCYELNGLFAALLKALGFRVTLLAAEVWSQKGRFGLPFDHMALLVDCSGRWLADVGFGDSALAPLSLDLAGEQVQGLRRYKIDGDGHERVLTQSEGGGFAAQYRFTLTPRRMADYEEMCRYHQTSPESPFTQRRVCSKATPAGRITLSDMRLITTSHGVREERLLASEAEYAAALREHFGIAL